MTAFVKCETDCGSDATRIMVHGYILAPDRTDVTLLCAGCADYAARTFSGLPGIAYLQEEATPDEMLLWLRP